MSPLRLIAAVLLPALAGCASHAPVPVVERDSAAAPAKPAAPIGVAKAESGAGYHTVKKGDTLYSIALDNGRDYREVAAWNNLENPNLIKIGQQLRVLPPDEGAPVAVAKPINMGTPVEARSDKTEKTDKADKPDPAAEMLKREPKGGKTPYADEGKVAEAKPADTKPVEKPADKPAAAPDDVAWAWPANGKLIAPFAEASNKGLDIAGKTGEPVLAAGDGVVSYVGAGLRGYGNLIVLRHNSSYLSVYAHNSSILVKEKQAVSRGQKIGEIGSSDAESPRLHFEIRRQGKPVDPQKYLPPR